MSYLSRFLKVSLAVVMLGLQVMTSLGVIADDRTEYEGFDDFYDYHFDDEFDLELTGYVDVITDDEGFEAFFDDVAEMLFADDTLTFVEGELFLPIEPRNVPAVGSGLVQFVLEPVNWNTNWGTLAQARAAAMNVATVYHRLYANQTTNNMAAAVNGAFGRDAIYLGQSANGNRLRVMIGAFEGYVPRVGQQRNITASVNGTNRTFAVTANAVFVPFNNYPNNTNNTTVRTVSHYVNRNGGLYRYLTNNVTTTGGFTRFLTGPAPSFMTVNTRYYSFDGVYFYRNPRNIRGNGSGAVNVNQPFFNYFQYLSFRSASRVTAAQLNNFLHNELGTVANRNNSVLTGQGAHFINAQNRYGVNALLSYSKALHESNRGLSSIARNNNNVFGLNAIDATPGQSASVFRNVQHSVNDYANNWMSRGYLWPGDWRYEGPHAGHKGSGMNVRYATDPYWGQKIAGWAFRIDRTLNHQDFNREQIAIRQNTSTVAVTNANGATTLYTANPRQVRFFPFLVTGTSGNQLRILTDAPIVSGATNRTALFNRNNAIGYIPNSNVWLRGASNPTTPPPTHDIVSPTVTLSPVQSAVTTVNNLNLRQGPGTTHSIIRSLLNGTSVVRLGTNANGSWSFVRIGSQYGWVSTTYLRILPAHQITSMRQTGVTRRSVTFRLGPSSNYALIRTINGDTNLRITGRTSSWYRVVVDGTVGWVRQNAVARTRQNAMVTTNNAHVRVARGTNYRSLTRVPSGQRVTIARQATSWSRITVNGHTGWIRNRDLSIENAMRPGRITGNNVAVHRRACSDSNIRHRLPRHTELMIIQRTTDGWSQVRLHHNNGTLTGWVRTNQLENRNHSRRLTQDSALRNGPASSYSRLRTVPRNTTVTVRARVGNWYYVHFEVNRQRQYGWLSRNSLPTSRLP